MCVHNQHVDGVLRLITKKKYLKSVHFCANRIDTLGKVSLFTSFVFQHKMVFCLIRWLLGPSAF